MLERGELREKILDYAEISAEELDELIPFFLEKALEDDEGCELFAPGLTLPGKVFREIEVEA